MEEATSIAFAYGFLLAAEIWLCGGLLSLGMYDLLPAQLSPEILLSQRGTTVTESESIDPTSSLGSCWAMNGTQGHIEFRLKK